jgi:hypothetical protein
MIEWEETRAGALARADAERRFVLVDFAKDH